MRLNMILSIISIFLLLTLGACANNEIKYDGTPLKIAVIGDIPELNNEKIHFEPISLDEFSEDVVQISTNFDAVMITPLMFEEASDDRFVDIYSNSEMPIIFFNSNRGQYPFVFEKMNYQVAQDHTIMDNGSHTTIFLWNVEENKSDTWYFYLKDEKELDVLYKEIFEKVETL